MSRIRREQLVTPLSASYAETASFALNAGGSNINTGSLVNTSSFNTFTASINNFTSSINVFTSSYNTGSFTGSFIGDLSGTASYALNIFPPFPYTGSARITGSLDIIGPTTITGSVLVSGSSIIFSGSQFEISNNIIINPNNRLLRSGSIISIDWGVRKLITSTGGNSIDWTNKYTYGSEGLISINYGSRDLIDSVGSASLSWGGRTLLTTNGFPALDWNSNFISLSETYINRKYSQEAQSSLASSIQYSGELINAAVSESATQYNLISLSSSMWIPTRQTDENSTKMLGIAINVTENITKGVILLNGDISFDGTEGPVIHPGVTNDDIGKPIYVRDGRVNMSLIPPTSGYIRIIGYVYYVDGSTYILRFNPSNNWYKI